MKKIFLVLIAGICLSSAMLFTMEREPKRSKVVCENDKEILNNELINELKQFKDEPPSFLIVKSLLAAGADPNAKNKWGEPVLHRAMYYPEIVEELIAYGVNVHATDDYGVTALFREANPKSVELLINSGADVNAQQSSSKEIPLHWAADRESKIAFPDDNQSDKVFRALLQAGAHVNSRNKYGKTPLHLAVQDKWGKEEGDDPYRETIVPQLQIFIDAGADVSIKDKYGKTILDCVLEDIDSDPEYKEAKIRTLVTAVSPAEIQHIIPMLTLLKTKIPELLKVPMPGEIQMLLRDKFIEQLVNDKIKLAKQYLPNDSEELLKPLILKNIITALKKSPPIQAATQVPAQQENLGVESMDTRE